MNCDVCHQPIQEGSARVFMRTRHHGCVRLNSMFHTQAGRLVKTSNNEEVPEDEPLFILRGRDLAAVMVLARYREYCRELGSPIDRLDSLANVINDFELYQATHKTKVPGSTHGA